MKYPIIVLVSVITLLTGYGCEKNVTTLEEPSSFIAAAKNYFESLPVQAAPNPRIISQQPPFRRLPKIVRWEKAIVKPGRVGKVVWVPVQYAKPVYLQTSYGGNHLFDINDMQWLLLYKDSLQAWHRRRPDDSRRRQLRQLHL